MIIITRNKSAARIETIMMVFVWIFPSGSGIDFGRFRSGINGSDDVNPFDSENGFEVGKMKLSVKRSDLVKNRICFSDAVNSNEYVKQLEIENSLDSENIFGIW